MNDVFIDEMFLSIDEAMTFIESASVDSRTRLKVEIIEPIMKVLDTKAGSDAYLKFGTEFIEANADMLAREFPTKRVSFPKKYVDNIFSVFGFDKDEFKKTFKEICADINGSDFKTIMATPTNVIHTIVLFYSDITYNRYVRDSARQQLALTVYHVMFNKFYHSLPDEKVMAYTYLHLNRNWAIIKAEDMMTWISDMVDSAYAFYKTKLTLNTTAHTIIMFLNRLRAQMRQSMAQLAHVYFKNQEEGNRVNDDATTGDHEYIVSDDTSQIRSKLMQLIKRGDSLYTTESNLYTGVAKLKNVSSKALYELAQQVSHRDIGELIDLIFYVFIVKENHKIEDINSSTYIGEITNMPTKIDRCIPGKPIIAPYVKKYKVKKELIVAYICLIATWIMMRINDVK
jgi:hypothetical protein